MFFHHQMPLIARKNFLEIIPDVYQISIRASNIFLIVEEELTLIDTGFPGSSAQIVKVIRNLGRAVDEISLIIITHNHIDHVGGLAELKRLTMANVALHQSDIGALDDVPSYPGGIRKLLRAQMFTNLRSTFAVPGEEVDIPLKGGEVLKPLGGLRIIHTPGHTPGSICLLAPRHKLIMVADNLSKQGQNPSLPHRMVCADFKQALDSVKIIAGLDFDILCFGHGQPISKNVRERMRKLVDRIKD